MTTSTGGTSGRDYTDRLARLEGARWKRLLDVQAPYRRNLRRLVGDGSVLDVGCGIGRHLRNLPTGSVGVDHNPESVQACRDQGLTAYTAAEFPTSGAARRGGFTALLAAHLVEHLPPGTAAGVLEGYLRHLAPGARLVLICPQERGFRSDPTHTAFFDDAALADLCGELGARVLEQSSFPFPRPVGRYFTYNEFVTLAARPGSSG